MIYMKEINNSYGFTKTELILCICALLALFAVGIKVFLDNNSQNYNSLKKEAENFLYKVSIYKDDHYKEDGYYPLYEVIDNHGIGELKNPLKVSEKCDEYESFVLLEGSKKSVTLKCGNYLVEGVQNGSFDIYEVTEWIDQRGGNDSQFMYNYSKDGVIVNTKYLLKEEFVDVYNMNEGASITSPNDSKPKNISLLRKAFYRDKKLIKTI